MGWGGAVGGGVWLGANILFLIIGAYYCFGFKFSDYRVSISLVC